MAVFLDVSVKLQLSMISSCLLIEQWDGICFLYKYSFLKIQLKTFLCFFIIIVIIIIVITLYKQADFSCSSPVFLNKLC